MRPGKLCRRSFMKSSAGAVAAVRTGGAMARPGGVSKSPPIRMGAPLFKKVEDPGDWAARVRELGYSAAYCPVRVGADPELVRAYAARAREADITIAEVGVWKNAISPDEETRQKALDHSLESLDLADRIGARCCVNVSGSRHADRWAGPHPENLTDETFDMIVEMCRFVIDAVKPTETYWTIEAMPWAYPHTVDANLQLLKAVDRKRFAIHLDPVNLVNSPVLYYRSGDLIRECFDKLGPYIRSCHAKDIHLRDDIYTTQLKEIRIGLGGLDYVTYLKQLSKFPEIPLMLEHLRTAEDFKLAADHLRLLASQNGLSFHSI